jgi:rSAM/selenodomain-associated transferase 1
MSSAVDLIVIAKEPRPGWVKTRLSPPYTLEQAAALATASLADTLRTVALTPAARRILVLEGEPGLWSPPDFEIVVQRGGGLDERLAAAFQDVYQGRPMVLIGMDTPQVTVALLAAATSALLRHDAVFGPAADGGFWLLGLHEPDPALLTGVPMSRPDTGAVQLGRLRAAGLQVGLMPVLPDVDTAQDAARVAAVAPYGRFARTFKAVHEQVGDGG